MFTLSKKQQIGHYTVVFPIKEGNYAETYRVKDAGGKNYFLKLINLSKLNGKQFDTDGNVIEVEIVKQLNHPNVMHFVETDELVLNGNRMSYLVSDFISGETLEQHTLRMAGCNPYSVREWLVEVLSGVQYLHSLPNPIVHNELTPQNIMMDSINKKLVIIDFGHARRMSDDRRTFDRKDLSPYYLAPETAGGLFSPQSDMFSVGVMGYQLLFGRLPWQVSKGNDFEDKLQAQRETPLKILDLSGLEVPQGLVETIAKAVSVDPVGRFQTVEEMIKVLKGESKIFAPPVDKVSEGKSTQRKSSNTQKKSVKQIKKKGNGFADVAGMDDLKAKLQRDIIKVLKDPEGAKRFGITIPNGILLYGPPGCGKTFFAEKLAKEIGSTYMYVKCSDVASPYIHGGQGKIAAIFNEARENAPTLLFLDEVEAMITDRSRHNNVSESGEVNEFLAQLNNCGEDRVTVIGATNKPDLIDEAALRSGRLALHYYIPQPNYEARKQLFEINLKNRAVDFGIDYDKLAKMTENYSCADIKEIVDNAGRSAFGGDSKNISQALLEKAVTGLTSHLTLDVIKKHEEIRNKFEQGNNEPEDWKKNRTMIGFKSHKNDE